MEVSSSLLGISPVPMSPLTGVTGCGSTPSETFSETCFGTGLALPTLRKLAGRLGCVSVP